MALHSPLERFRSPSAEERDEWNLESEDWSRDTSSHSDDCDDCDDYDGESIFPDELPF